MRVIRHRYSSEVALLVLKYKYIRDHRDLAGSIVCDLRRRYSSDVVASAKGRGAGSICTQFTCFASALKFGVGVGIPVALLHRQNGRGAGSICAQFTCVTSTEVQILTS